MFHSKLIIAFTSLATVSFAAPVEITTPELRGAVQPQLAVAPSGRIHVVFGQANTVYHTSSADGQTFSPPVKVGTLEKLALKMRRGPRVTATDQQILVTAISHADGDLHAWTSSDGGKTFREQPPLNSVPGSAREGMQALAGNGRGAVAVVWLDLRQKGTQLWARFSKDGGTTWDQDRSIYASPAGHICECCHPTVAFAESGALAVMWRNWLDGARDIFARTSADAGKTFTAAQKLGEGTWKLNACPMDGGHLAADREGKWSAAWRREAGVFVNAVGAPEKKTSADGKQPVIGFAGASRILLWEEGGALMLQRGDDSPKRFAGPASGACIVSGRESAVVAYESGPNGAGGLFVDRVR